MASSSIHNLATTIDRLDNSINSTRRQIGATLNAFNLALGTAVDQRNTSLSSPSLNLDVTQNRQSSDLSAPQTDTSLQRSTQNVVAPQAASNDMLSLIAAAQTVSQNSSNLTKVSSSAGQTTNTLSTTRSTTNSSASTENQPTRAAATASPRTTTTSPASSRNPQINQDAVAAAKADNGTYSNGLTVYKDDPTSNAWKLQNIGDPNLRQQLDNLPLSRSSMLDILSSSDPYQAIGNIYKSMGTYSTVGNYGNADGKTVAIRDNDGNTLHSFTWAPTTNNDTPWTSANGEALRDKLEMYGVQLSNDVDWSSMTSVIASVNQHAPAGSYKQSPVTEYIQYGFNTDPLTGEVVGGGSTAAIDSYNQSRQLLPKAAALA